MPDIPNSSSISGIVRGSLPEQWSRIRTGHSELSGGTQAVAQQGRARRQMPQQTETNERLLQTLSSDNFELFLNREAAVGSHRSAVAETFHLFQVERVVAL